MECAGEHKPRSLPQFGSHGHSRDQMAPESNHFYGTPQHLFVTSYISFQSVVFAVIDGWIQTQGKHTQPGGLCQKHYPLLML